MEINISHYNEKLKYEKEMDSLRALIIWATGNQADIPHPGMPQPREYVFDIVKQYSFLFAQDIHQRGSIDPDSINHFHSSLYSVFNMLEITPEYVEKARLQQRFINSGFWGEMRRCIGQFSDIAEAAVADGVSHIVTCAVSGCVIGEYVGLLMGGNIPVDHMIFSRNGTEPVQGYLSKRCNLKGSHILVIDDVIMDCVTLPLARDTLDSLITPDVLVSVSVIDVDWEAEKVGCLVPYHRVYRPDEI
jgi:adenine/guanine phosphoribosyltransferase-like PRPP-binding protein